MIKRTLSQWASMAEIFGSFAIVLSLIFVGLEIRQNTDQVEAASIKTSYNFFDVVFELGGNAENNEILIRGLYDFDSLTIGEKVILDNYHTKVGIEFDIARDLYLRGFLGEEQYLSYEELMARMMLSPGITTLFRIVEPSVPPVVRDKLNQMMIDYKHLDPLSEYFKYKPGFK